MLRIILAVALAICLCGGANAAPDSHSLDGHLVAGYQGWFSCPGDVGDRGMAHWLRGDQPSTEMLPDLREVLPKDECALAVADLKGPPPMVYSSANAAIVNLHFRWMQQYGIDTAAVQRFVSVVKADNRRRFADAVLNQVRRAAERHHRTFFVEYDLSGSDPADIALIAADLRALVASGLTASAAYQRIGDRPLVGFWGLGFSGRPWTPAGAAELMKQARSNGAAVMIGVPAWWRTGTHDASPDADWLEVYKTADVLTPWTVGRYSSIDGIAGYDKGVVAEDLAWATSHHVQYLPTVFPGFSWSNLKPGSPKNQIPRLCGRFFQAQVDGLASLQARAIFVAMFDELDEGTAIFKVRPHPLAGPDQDRFLALDADGCDLKSDAYLRLAGQAGRSLSRSGRASAP